MKIRPTRKSRSGLSSADNLVGRQSIFLQEANNVSLKPLILFAMTFLIIGNIGADSPSNYISLVDGYNGFGKIINTSGPSPLYENHTLNIIVGDSITWVNNDESDKITIISGQKLWKDNDVVLIHAGRKYSYTFNNTGVYTFNISEYDAFPKQIIIVSNIGDVVDTIPEDIADKIVENVTDTIPEVTNDKITENVTGTIDENVTYATENITDTTDGNMTVNMTNNRTSLVMSVFAPLNILGNLKITGIITFVVIVMISLIKD